MPWNLAQALTLIDTSSRQSFTSVAPLHVNTALLSFHFIYMWMMMTRDTRTDERGGQEEREDVVYKSVRGDGVRPGPTFLWVGSVIFKLHMAVCGRPLEDFGSLKKERRPHGSWPISLIWRTKTNRHSTTSTNHNIDTQTSVVLFSSQNKQKLLLITQHNHIAFSQMISLFLFLFLP